MVAAVSCGCIVCFLNFIVYLHLPVNTHGSGCVMWLYCIFVISLYVYIYQLIPMVAAVSCGCIVYFLFYCIFTFTS